MFQLDLARRRLTFLLSFFQQYRAFALGLAREGARVVVASRTQSHLDQAASQIISMGGRALAVTVNLAEESSVQNLVEQTVK